MRRRARFRASDTAHAVVGVLACASQTKNGLTWRSRVNAGRPQAKAPAFAQRVGQVQLR